MLSEFSAAELRRRFANAFPPQPWMYWSDLVVSTVVGWGAFVQGAEATPGSLLHIVATIVAVLALLRAAVFIHELAHLHDDALPGFSIAWHIVVGLPLLTPSVMYVGSHNDHHRQPTFGTIADPEYALIAQWSRLRIVRFVLSLVFVPFLLILRWGVVGPISFFIPPLHRLLIKRASTLVINPAYRRPLPQGKRVARWVMQEIAVAVVFWGIAVSTCWHWLPIQWIVQWYVVTAGILMVNQIRTLAAHRYDNGGAPLDATAQLLDSVTLSGGSLLTVLAAPVGLRFHALHHLLPTVPYHSLGALHRKLLAELSPDGPYARTQERGIVAAVRALLSSSRAVAPTLTVDRVAPEA